MRRSRNGSVLRKPICFHHCLPPICWMDALDFDTGMGRIFQEPCRRNRYGRMFNKIFYPLCPFFVITGVYGGTRTCGKHRDRYDMMTHRRIRMWYLCVLLIHLSLPFSKVPKFQVNFLAGILSATSVGPSFPTLTLLPRPTFFYPLKTTLR